MFHGASGIVRIVLMLRIVAVAIVLGSISFGIYRSLNGAIAMGLLWVTAAVVGGFVANMFFRFAILLTSSNVAASVRR